MDITIKNTPEVKITPLEEGTVLVLEAPMFLTEEDKAQLKAQFASIVSPARILLLAGGITLSAVLTNRNP